MAFKNKLKTFFSGEEEFDNTIEDDFYSVDEDSYQIEAEKAGSNMILIEPRAYSESQTIADHLRKRNTVVVSLERVTSAQAKRIIDFLTGTLYAIGGDLQKLGNGIYLCTPKNVNVQGKIEEKELKDKRKIEDEIEF